MKSNLGQKILNFEASINFKTRWYAILFNPYFIDRRRLYRAIADFARTTDSSAAILDVGCGIKPYQHLFSTNQYIGIDIKGGGHSHSQKVVDKFFDGQSIPYDDQRFDIVISTQVFEHAENLEALVVEINRILKPGGQLFITMPFVWDEHEIPYDFRRFTTFGHRQLIEPRGFEIVSIKKTTGIFGTTSQLFSAFFIEQFAAGLDRLKLKFRYNYPLKKLFTLVVCFPLQLLGLLFDTLCRRNGITLDYVIIAKKK